MKTLQKILYKEQEGIIIGILENGKIAITLPYRIKDKLYGYIRKEVEPQEIELL